MPPLTPDVEVLIGQVLRAAAPVRALVGDRVGGRTPATTADAWVRITQIDDQPLQSSRALHLVTVFLQLDCYGGDDIAHAQSEASTLARTVRDVLNELPGPVAGGAVVSAVKFGGTHRIPDPDFTPQRERFIVNAEVTVHP